MNLMKRDKTKAKNEENTCETEMRDERSSLLGKCASWSSLEPHFPIKENDLGVPSTEGAGDR